jgi:hypothetical protein
VSPDRNDWIKSCDSQLAVRAVIDQLVNNLHASL